MTRDLNALYPQTKAKVEKLLAMANADAKSLGVDKLIVTSTYRSFAEQQALFNQGRTTPGNIVTHALPGESFHNVRRAVDVVWVKDGKALYDDKDNPPWDHIGLLAIQCDLVWGGKWKSPKRDRPHLQDEWAAEVGNYRSKATSFNEDGTVKK